jgi:hypothetical protein
MRIVTYILIIILIGVLGAGAYLYLYMYQPMAAEHALLKAGQPGMEKALRKFQDQDKQERAWTGPLAGMLQSGLAAEIASGKAEVVVAGNRVVVNLAEELLYTPQSVTFAKDSQPLQLRLAGLFKEVKDKEVLVGNMTQPAPAQGRGRRRVPAKDARTLAAARSHELVKALVRNGVPDASLVSAAYGAAMPDRGYKIKNNKTMFIISAHAPAEPAAVQPVAQPQARPASAPAGTASAPSPPQQPQPIPITPTPPRQAR